MTTDASNNVIGIGEGNAITKMSADGVVEWQIELAVTDEAMSLAADAASNIIVTGMSDSDTGEGGTDAFIHKYDSSGQLLWSVDASALGGEATVGTSVATDDTQSVFMAGVTDGAVGASAQTSGHSDRFLIKISPDGDMLWTRQFDNSDQQDFVQSASADRYEGPGTQLWVDSMGCGERRVAGRVVCVWGRGNGKGGHVHADDPTLHNAIFTCNGVLLDARSSALATSSFVDTPKTPSRGTGKSLSPSSTRMARRATAWFRLRRPFDPHRGRQQAATRHCPHGSTLLVRLH